MSFSGWIDRNGNAGREAKMVNLQKRLKDIENRINPEPTPTAIVAMIRVDGSAELTHNEKKISFNDRAELEAYVTQQGINRKHLLIVEIVNAKNSSI